MKNLPFTLWMLMYPLSTKLYSYLRFLETGKSIYNYNPIIGLICGLLDLGIWFYVGYKLYVPNNSKITKQLFQDSKPITNEIKEAIEETSKRLGKNKSKFKSRL